jgi:AraC family transcriptional regulator of adaptative response/methylated-DNA-[protein]-cysteine methyltransferase
MSPLKPTPRDDAARWKAVTERDASADGQFYYAVRTTGVYCRPSCGARLPRRENVSFHVSPADARRAGFRACKRCRPDAAPLEERRARLVARACRQIEDAAETPSLRQLAAAAGLSPHHFHRTFKAVTGITPKAYVAARRAERVRRELGAPGSVTDAIYGAGYNSNARFYAASGQILGMTPTAFRQGGRDAVIRFALGECSLGSILVAATEKGICAISLGADPQALLRELEDRFPQAELRGGDRKFERLVAKAVGMVEAPGKTADLPLDIRGTAFQQRVWQALREIPAGTTASYSEIAARLGRPRAVRAVAAACASNTIAVAIPCHRVVRSDGALAGYRWGVERKRALIGRERRSGPVDRHAAVREQRRAGREA